MASKHEPCKKCTHRTLTMSLYSESELKGLEMSSEDKSGFLSLLFVSAQNPLWKFVWRQSFILKQTVKLTDIKRSFFHIALTSFQTTDLWQSEVFRLKTKLWGTSIKYKCFAHRSKIFKIWSPAFVQTAEMTLRPNSAVVTVSLGRILLDATTFPSQLYCDLICFALGWLWRLLIKKADSGRCEGSLPQCQQGGVSRAKSFLTPGFKFSVYIAWGIQPILQMLCLRGLCCPKFGADIPLYWMLHDWDSL